MLAILGATALFIGIAALCGKPSKYKPEWVHMIYEEHRQKLIDRS